MPPFDLHLKLGLALGLLEIAALFALVGLARLLGRRPRPTDLAIGFLLPFVILGPYLATGRLFVPTAAWTLQIPGAPPAAQVDSFDLDMNDAVFQLLPWESEVRHALGAGRLPLWSDTVGGGSELWGNLQTQVLSPIALGARLFPLRHHLLASFALKLLIAFLGATLLARAHGVRPAWARSGGLAFALGGALAGWAVLPPSAVACWAPWVALGTLRLARHPGRRAGRRAVIGTALATAALLTGGNPEVAFAAVLFAGLLAVALGRWRSGRRPGRWTHGVAAAAGAGLLGTLLVAPLWLPFLHLVEGSQRAHEQRHAAAPAGEGPARYANYLLGPLHPAPAMGGGERSPNPLAGERAPWSHCATGYGGLAALFGLGLLLARPAPRRFWPAALFFLATLLAVAELDDFERLGSAVRWLSFADSSRFLPVGLLGLAVAGAGGLETLVRRRGARRRAATLALVASLSLLAGAAGPVLLGWALLAVTTARGPARPRAAAWLAAAVALLDLAPFSWRLLPRGEREQFLPATSFMARMSDELAAPGGPWRATGQDLLVFPSLLPAYGIAELRPHDPLVPHRQIEVLAAAFGFHPTTRSYFSPLARLDHPLLDFLGVRAVVTNAYLPTVPGMERIDRGEAEPQPFRLLRNPDALPRAFFPSRIERVAPRDLARWIDALDDAKRVAVDPAEVSGLDLAIGSGDVRTVANRAGRLELALPAQARDVLLALSIPASAGWSARSVERPLRTLRVDGAFLGVAVPAGARQVELTYRPRGLVTGAVLALVAATVLLALTRTGLSRRRR